MGTAASIFDCATNPLHPVPEAGGSAEAGDDDSRDIVLEHQVPLRSSLIWRLQRAFYDDRGLTAWSDAVVPNFVTSNSFIAGAYARVVLGLLQDVYGAAGSRNPATDYAQPVYIVELGAGHGKLGYLVVEALLRYRAFFPATDCMLPFKYVLTDVAATNVEAWLQHPHLVDFMEAGALDVAVFDAERDSELRLRKCGVTLKAGAVANPVVFLANYVFDSLATDAFRIENGALQQGCVSLHAQPSLLATGPGGSAPLAGGVIPPEERVPGTAGLTVPVELPPQTTADDAAAAGTAGQPTAAPDKRKDAAAAGAAGAGSSGAGRIVHVPPSALPKLELTWSYKPLPSTVATSDALGAAAAGTGAGTSSSSSSAAPMPAPRYTVYGAAAPLLDALLSAYAASPSLKSAASLLLPTGGLQALQSALRIANGRMLLLVADKGATRLREMEGARDPHVASHGSVSLMVNFHALTQVAKAYGASSLVTPHFEGFKTGAFFFGSPTQPRGPLAPLHTSFPIRSGSSGSSSMSSVGSSGSSSGDGAAAGSVPDAPRPASVPDAPRPASVPDAPRPAFGFADEDDEDDLGLRHVSVAKPGYLAALASLKAATSAAAGGAAAASAASAAGGTHPYLEARAAVREHLTGGFTVDDFSTLQRSIKDECPDPSLKHVLALLRLAGHDTDVFLKFKGTLIEKTPSAPADTVLRDVRADVERLYAGYYPLQRSKDVCFECGRLLMSMRDYPTAVEFFAKSNELCGAHHITWHNMGMCHFYMEDYDSALECFKSSMALKPDYAEARLWWDKTTARAAAIRNAADGYDDEDEYVVDDARTGKGGSGSHHHDAADDAGAGVGLGLARRGGGGGGAADAAEAAGGRA